MPHSLSGVASLRSCCTDGVDGDRSSEHMLGVALKGRREEAVIASKFGMHVGEDTTQYSGEMVAEAIDASLAALQTDYIDIMQIHCAAQLAPAPLLSLSEAVPLHLGPGNIGYEGADTSAWSDAQGVVAALETAVFAGKIKHCKMMMLLVLSRFPSRQPENYHYCRRALQFWRG